MTAVITPAPAPAYKAHGIVIIPDVSPRGLPQRIRKADGTASIISRYAFHATATDIRTGKEYAVGIWHGGALAELATELHRNGRLIPEAHLAHIRQVAADAYRHWFALKTVIVLGRGSETRRDSTRQRTGWTLGGTELDQTLEAHLVPPPVPAAAFEQLDKMTRRAAHDATAPGIVRASPRYHTPHGLLVIDAMWHAASHALTVRLTLNNETVTREKAAAAVAAQTAIRESRTLAQTI